MSASAPAERLGTAAFIKRVFTPDFGKIRPVSGLRRAAVVAAVILVTNAFAGLPVAASTGVTALLVGFLDRRQSPPAVFRTMAAGTLALTATTYVTHLINPWPVLVLLLLGLIAFSEGASVAVHPDAPIVLHFCGVVSATALLEPQSPQTALSASVGVFLAGSTQLVTTVASAYGSRTVREYATVSGALMTLADAMTTIAADPAETAARQRAPAAVAATGRAMSEAQATVSKSDLELSERMLLEEVLWSAERLRLDTKALAMPPDRGVAGEVLPQGSMARGSLLRSAELLRAGADALLSRPSKRAEAADLLEAMSTKVAGAPPAASDGDGRTPPALPADVTATTIRFVHNAVDLLRGGHGRRRSRVTTAERLASIRTAARPGSLSFRIGLRLVIASALAIAAGATLGLVHASWAVNATLSIFRPDGGGMLARLILRAAGNIVGALLVVGVALAANGSLVLLAAAALFFVCLVYVYGPANYGLFAFFLSVSVLSILAFTGADPETMALARLVDTLIGCTVALAVAFALPLWEASLLPGKVAGFCQAVGLWLGMLGRAARVDPDGRDLDVDRRAEAGVRDAVSDVLTSLRVSQLEPSGNVPVGHVVGVFENGRQVARHGLVAEHLLAHGAAASASGAQHAEAAALLMRQAGQALQGDTTDAAPGMPHAQPGTDDRLGSELVGAWRSAVVTRRRAAE